MIDDQLLGDRRSHGDAVHVHAVIPESGHYRGSVISVQGNGVCPIIVAAVSHPPVVVGIDMVFRGKDADERLVPGIHGIAESREHQERFTGSEFPVSQCNPVDLDVLDGCFVERYGRIVVRRRDLWLGRGVGSTCAARHDDQADGESNCQDENVVFVHNGFL